MGLYATPPLNVIATIPDLGWMVKEIGQDQVSVRSLLKGSEDPHYVDAVPKFVLLASKADVVISAGLDLEVGWLPKVLEQSANPKVQPGGRGYIEAGNYISVLEKQTTLVDRSMGDIHPRGNPHFYLSPKRLSQAAEGVAATLASIRPEHAEIFYKNLELFQQKMDLLLMKGKEKINTYLTQNNNSILMMEYHRELVYWANDYGIPYFGSIEEKPGVPPSAGYLGKIGLKAKQENVTVILVPPYAPKATIKQFSSISTAPIRWIPTMIQKNTLYSTYETEQDYLIESVLTPTSSK